MLHMKEHDNVSHADVQTYMVTSPQSLKPGIPGYYTGTLSQRVGMEPGKELTENTDSAIGLVLAPEVHCARTTPDLHCRWDLMLLPRFCHST